MDSCCQRIPNHTIYCVPSTKITLKYTLECCYGQSLDAPEGGFHPSTSCCLLGSVDIRIGTRETSSRLFAGVPEDKGKMSTRPNPVPPAGRSGSLLRLGAPAHSYASQTQQPVPSIPAPAGSGAESSHARGRCSYAPQRLASQRLRSHRAGYNWCECRPQD